MPNKLKKQIIHQLLKSGLGITIGYLIFGYIYYSELGIFPNKLHLINQLIILAFSLTFTYIILFTSKLINRFWNWTYFSNLKIIVKTILLTIICYVIFKLLLYNIFNYWPNITTALESNQTNIADITAKWLILSFSILLCFTISNYLNFAYNSYILKKVKGIEQEKEKSFLQLEMLQKQLSPHYLFNSLNTISSLLDKDPGVVEKFIRKLVYTYSFILSSCKKETVLLKEELKLIEAYKHQIDTRLDNGIEIKYRIPNDFLNYHIPPLALQTLVENAIKHNLSTTNEPLIIVIEIFKNKLLVKNNITTAPTTVVKSNIGLKNLQKRYSLLGNYNLIINQNTNFSVQIPLIND